MKMSNKSGFASSDYTAGQLNAIVKKMIDQAGKDAPERFLAGTIKLVAEVINYIVALFTFTVDETKTVEELVKAGNFDCSNEYITSENFPQKENGQKKEKEIAIFHFGKNMSSDNVIAEMDKVGYKPATIWDLISLAIKEPDLQRKFPIIALSSVCVLGGGRDVACLYGGDSGRKLRLYYFVRGWFGNGRFAGVRK
jgi:hypothetical protein